MTRIEKERNSCIVEFRINLKTVLFGKKKKRFLSVNKGDLLRRVPCRVQIHCSWDLGPVVAFMSCYPEVRWPVTGACTPSAVKSGCGAVWFSPGLIDCSWSWKQTFLHLTPKTANSCAPGFTTSWNSSLERVSLCFWGWEHRLWLCLLELYSVFSREFSL